MSNEKAAGIIYLSGDKILLLKRQQNSVNGGTWGLPAGKVEDGESSHDAALRESFEEIGYLSKAPLKFIHDDGFFTTYLSRDLEFKPKLNEEHTEYNWFDLKKLPHPLHPGTLDKLSMVKKMSNRKTDINGFLEIKDNPISKIGVFPYSGRAIGAEDPDKIYMVYRPEEELSDPETIESFKFLPWIDDHPDGKLLGDGAGYEAPEDKGIDGATGESVYYKDGTLFANIKAFANKLKKAIKNGKIELSAGFRCLYEKASGTFNGQAYDYIQRSIRGNHLALVDQGRMGPEVAVLDRFTFTFDAKELEMADENKEVAQDQEPTMAEVVAMVKDLAEKVAKITEGKVEVEVEPAADEDPKKAVEEAAAMAKDEDMEKPEGDACDEDKEKSGMDAMEKRLAKLEAENKALKAGAVKSVVAEVAQRDSLAKRLTPHIGAFDHAEKTLVEVAEYGVKKLGINVPKGHEITALNSYLAAKSTTGASVALDGAQRKNSSVIDSYLSGNA